MRTQIIPLCFSLLLACGCSSRPVDTAYDAGIREPEKLKVQVKQSLSGEDQPVLEGLQFTSGSSGPNDFYVQVQGVIPSPDVAGRIKSAIEQAIQPEGGQIKWLVTANAHEKPPEIRLPGEATDGGKPSESGETAPTTETTAEAPPEVQG